MRELKDISPQGLEKFTWRVLRARRAAFEMPKEVSDKDPVLNAEINHGRWIVQCDSCAGAELVDVEDLRFFCLSCYNKAHDGRWLRVKLPEAKQEIEAVLLEREPQNQHWEPGETIKDLQSEQRGRV